MNIRAMSVDVRTDVRTDPASDLLGKPWDLYRDARTNPRRSEEEPGYTESAACHEYGPGPAVLANADLDVLRRRCSGRASPPARAIH